MKNETEKLLIEAQQTVESVLREIPFVQMRPNAQAQQAWVSEFMRPDFAYELDVGDTPMTLIVEFKTNGQPRYARAAVNNLLRIVGDTPSCYAVFVAPYISQRSADICREAGVGYIDFAGNVRITLAKVFIDRTGRPKPQSEKRYIRSLYSPKAERVLRVLLNDGKRRWKLDGLRSRADVSIGHVSNVKKRLVDCEWMDKSPEGWYLTKPADLLDQWAEQNRLVDNQVSRYYSSLSPGEIEQGLESRLAETGLKWGFTGFAAAARYSPAVTYKKTTVYVEEIPDDLVTAVGLKKVPSGANVELVVPYDEGVFYWTRRRRDITVVSAVQVYLDLVRDRGRGQEAAETLRDYIRSNIWHKPIDDNQTRL